MDPCLYSATRFAGSDLLVRNVLNDTKAATTRSTPNMNAKLIYNAKQKRSDIANHAAAIYCSDNRFQHVFREFLVEGLGLTSYALLAIPGGGHFPAMDNVIPRFARTEFESLGFLIRRTGAERIILIGHDDCLFFKEQLQYLYPEPQFNEKQFVSLRSSARMIGEHFQGLAVEVYFADAASDGTVQILRIE